MNKFIILLLVFFLTSCTKEVTVLYDLNKCLYTCEDLLFGGTRCKVINDLNKKTCSDSILYRNKVFYDKNGCVFLAAELYTNFFTLVHTKELSLKSCDK